MKWETTKLIMLAYQQAHGKCKPGSAEIAGDCTAGPTATGSKCLGGPSAIGKCKGGLVAQNRCDAGGNN